MKGSEREKGKRGGRRREKEGRERNKRGKNRGRSRENGGTEGMREGGRQKDKDRHTEVTFWIVGSTSLFSIAFPFTNYLYKR